MLIDKANNTGGCAGDADLGHKKSGPVTLGGQSVSKGDYNESAQHNDKAQRPREAF
jgi:hypothetical protein